MSLVHAHTLPNLNLSLPLQLADDAKNERYANRVHSHLNLLIKLDLERRADYNFSCYPMFDLRRYSSLEQSVLEGLAPDASSNQIDQAWVRADDEADAFDRWIDDLPDDTARKNEAYVTYMRGIVENGAFYHALTEQRLETSAGNPWKSLIDVFCDGILLNVNEQLSKDARALQFTSRARKSARGSLQVGRQYAIRAAILERLAKAAEDVENAHECPMDGESLISELRQVLGSRFPTIKKEGLQTAYIAPMKRAGLIGSMLDGYFILKSVKDCQKTMEFHRHKKKAIEMVITAAGERMQSMASDSA